MTSTRSSSSSMNKALLLAAMLPTATMAQCLSNATVEAFFSPNGETLPAEGSCCMQDICGLTCPPEFPGPKPGYGIAVACSIVISVIVGCAACYLVKGQSVNYFVAGRSLPLFMVFVTLASQAVDSNALLGNVDLSYRFGFWDGAVLPIGLGISLVLNGIFLAHHVNNDEVLTLPDILAKRYGRVVETLASFACVVSFIMLLAGNLLGYGVITAYLWNISEEAAIWLAALCIWLYTVLGGLFSVAYTDVVQGLMGWTGCLVLAFYMIANEDPSAPPQSIGFPGYIYPDTMDDPTGACATYDGVACTNDVNLCCYNIDKWCPGYDADPTITCEVYDRGAYPFGDLRVYPGSMTDSMAYAPFPNALFWNWATIFILGFGNLGALDFQARCMAATTPRVARIGCVMAGLFTILIGIPFSYLGAITRVYYGPDSIYATYEADTCSAALGLAQCAMWVPDGSAFIKLLTHQVSPFLGAWGLIGIIAASMSTASGAILAMGTVMAHNVARQLDTWFPTLVTPENLLNVSRMTTVPFTIASTCIAAFYRSSSGGGTGYLLIVAFDIVLATVVVPLFGCFYCKKPSPRAALLGICGGAATRIILEFVLPKDGFLILPFDDPVFFNYGTAPNALFPFFVDVPVEEQWNPADGACQQEQYTDYTGVDSLCSPLVCLFLFCMVQTIEHYSGKPLFTFGGSEPYIKDTTEHPLKKTLQIGNMGIPVTAYEEGDAEPLETRVSFADESGKPVKTVASAEGEVTLDDEPAEAAGCGLFGQIGSLEAASPSSSTGS